VKAVLKQAAAVAADLSCNSNSSGVAGVALVGACCWQLHKSTVYVGHALMWSASRVDVWWGEVLRRRICFM
jgi:hypothetical protein